jgi:hypothetical protein
MALSLVNNIVVIKDGQYNGQLSWSYTATISMGILCSSARGRWSFALSPSQSARGSVKNMLG